MDHAPYRDATKTRRQKLLDSEGDPGNGTRKVPHLAVKANGNHWILREGAGEYKRAADAIWILKRRAVCSVLCMSKAKASLPSFPPSLLPFLLCRRKLFRILPRPPRRGE